MGSIRTRIFIPSTSLTLISHLQGKIVEKSRLYEDEALQNIFLMNNLLYIVQKVKDSELKTLLGDNWIRKRRGKIRQYSTGYFRSSWTRTLACLIDDGLPQAMGSSCALKNALKGRFKNFNLHSRSCTGHILHGGLWINSVGF
jgi:exocyst complex component 7